MSINGKTIFGTIAALALGALGNGAWEYVLKPAFSWGLAGILNIATLGVQTFKDDLYREIAQGFHEESSLSLASLFYFLLGYGAVFGLFILMRKSKEIVAQAESSSKDLDELEVAANGHVERAQTKDVNARISKLRAELSALMPRAKRVQKTSRVLFAFGIAFFAWVVIGNAKDRYINSAIAHYKQSFSIVAPAATTAELSSFNSRFARVASKSDYEVLMVDIARVGARENLAIPAFKPW